jgi:FtsP/CotA-like multicopper oxidase with cupredoxin domain
MLRGGELGADLFLINGRMHGAIPPLRLARDERILLRIIHAGAIPHPMHTHGHSFTVVATDGNPVPAIARLTKDTLLIGPAERYDLAITGNNPGVWMVHCHIEHHMANGMMTTLWYDGEQPAGPYGAFQDAPSSHSDDSMTAVGTSSTMDGMAMAPDATAEPASTQPPVDGNAFEIAMIDDRFDPASATITTGTTVTWVNKGRDWHSVAAFDGSFESGKIAPGELFTYQFTTSGTYQYLCKHHGMQGMIGVITANDPD